MEDKSKKKIRTLTEDMTALIFLSPEDKSRGADDSKTADDLKDEDHIKRETIKDQSRDSSESQSYQQDYLKYQGVKKHKFRTSFTESSILSERSSDDQDTLMNNQSEYADKYYTSHSRKKKRIQTQVNDDHQEIYGYNDKVLDDYKHSKKDGNDDSSKEFHSDRKKEKHPARKSVKAIGRTAVVVNRATRTATRLQEGRYTSEPDAMIRSMGRTAAAPVRRKARNTAIKKTKKVIINNRISRIVRSTTKALSKSIFKVVTYLLGVILVAVLPVIVVFALIVSIFGMGGADQSVIQSYEHYMTSINEENREYVDRYREEYPTAEVYSSQGNDYGFVNWRAVLSSCQILYGDKMSFSQEERSFLADLKENQLYERYKETEETRTIENEKGEKIEIKVKVLTITNPGIDEYIDFLKKEYHIEDMDEQAIRTLYVSPDLMNAFSADISGIIGGGKIFDDEKIQNLFSEGEKYLGRPYVWGGSSPSTGFDCSGFVCYIYTKTGTYDLPRTTAQGIYNQCIPISESEAKPGDLIFFTGTYDTLNPVTHIGIYAGDGIMLHCGDPIQYASYRTPYWRQHFYGFGRLK